MSPTFTTFKSPEKAIISVNNLQKHSKKNRMKKLSLNQQSLGTPPSCLIPLSLALTVIITTLCLTFFMFPSSNLLFFLFLSISVYLFLFTYLFIHLNLFLFKYFCICFICVSFNPYLCLSLCFNVCSINLSLPYLFKSVLMYHI